MWSYYGSKSKVISYYTPPMYQRVIEPFAGTAQYALRYFDHDVLLVDKYDVIVRVWKWLQRCSKQDVLGLPRLKFGQSVDDFKWDCDEARWFVGMIITGGPTQPKKSASRWKTEIRPNTQNYKLQFAADNLYKIRHWKVELGSYEEIPNQEGCWFIDPPYQVGGNYYVHGNKGIQYRDLANWCRSRIGQVIVCENTKADWMPFKPLVEMQGNRYRTTEAVWETMPAPVQLKLAY